MVDHSFSNVLSPVSVIPKSFPNWPTIIWIDMPVMNPAMIAFDMKLAIQPMRARPRTMNTAPVANANAMVRATAVS